MSKPQYETYGPYGHEPHGRDLHGQDVPGRDPYGHAPRGQAPYGHDARGHAAHEYAADGHDACGHGGGYRDTYRPAYEAEAYLLPEPSVPRPRPVADGPGAVTPEAEILEAEIPEAEIPEAEIPGTEPPETVVLASGRGPRRRRARPGERPESAMRRLLPQALVVAFLAGGTTAFVAKDKAIELNVDGKPRTLHTFADDVTELLAEEGVQVGAHDMVAPGPGTALASGDEVAVRYGRPVRLTLDGERREVWTTAHTVDGALRELGVRAEGAYLSASRSRSIGRAGLALDVRTERAVTFMADGRTRTIRTNAATVGGAIEEAGITLHGQDTTSVPLGSFPRDGQTVTVLRVTGAREVREEQIPFHVQRTDDPTLFKGTEVVDQQGVPGLRRVTYLLRTVNGVREKPRQEDSEVVRRPLKEVVRVGTKLRPSSVQGADGLNWNALAVCESGGRPGAVDPSGTYGGLYQFDSRTWHSLGGSGRPQDASSEEQTYRAKKLYVRRGTSPWPHCGSRLHS